MADELWRPSRGTRDGRRARGLGRALRGLSRVAWFLESELAGLPQLVGPGDVCLDVGAEYGLYTHVLSGIVGAEGTVLAVEPQRDAAAILRRGMALVGGADLVHTHAAISDRPGRTVMQIPMRRGRPVHGRAHIGEAPAGEDPNDEFDRVRVIDIDLTTVDALVEAAGLARVDFIKADVEGAEAKVLDGAAATLDRWHPTVQLEIEDRYTGRFDTSTAAITRRLTDRGYGMFTWDGGRWVPASRVTDARRNYVFIHASGSAEF